MKKYLLFIAIFILCCGFTLPEQPDSVRIETIQLDFDADGNLINCRLSGSLLKSGEVVQSGRKTIFDSLPSAHITQYETYRNAYENALEADLGL